MVDQNGLVPANGEQAMWQRFLTNLAKYRTALTLVDSMREAMLILGGNGIVEDPSGTEARFTVATERGVESYELGLGVLTAELARVGIALEMAQLEPDEVAARHLVRQGAECGCRTGADEELERLEHIPRRTEEA